MVVFVDTSAIYAAADRDDVNHTEAARRLKAALDAAEELVVHNYVVLESVALFHRRRGWEAARDLLKTLGNFRIRWVDESLHGKAVQRFIKRGGQFSFVDEVSFLVMREAGARHALAFDQHFTVEGFLPYPP